MAMGDTTMITVDLMAREHYPPLDTRTPEQLFDLAVLIVRTLDNVAVRAPVGEGPEESVVLTSKLMRKKGVALF